LNRLYKPLGLSDYSQFADYQDPKYHPLWLPDDQINRQWLKGSDYFFNDGTSPVSMWGLPASHKNIYLLKLWLVFRPLGMLRPDLSFGSLRSAAKAVGAPIDLAMGMKP